MRTPTRIRRTAARIATGTLLTTLALGLVAAPGLAEEVAPATPGPHTIPESPILPEDMGLPAPEEPGFTCEDWRDLHEIYPGLPWADTPECPVEEDEADASGPTFPVDEIPLPDGVEEIPLPFDPGEVPLPLDPGGAADDEEEERPEEDATPEGEDSSEDDDTDDSTDDPDDASEGADDTEDAGDGSDDGSGDGGDDGSRDTEVEGTSTEAGPDASDGTAAGSDETPTPTRVDAGAGGSVLTVDRRDAILVVGLVLALGMVITGGVLLARSTRA